jgi:hypothetical protein
MKRSLFDRDSRTRPSAPPLRSSRAGSNSLCKYRPVVQPLTYVIVRRPNRPTPPLHAATYASRKAKGKPRHRPTHRPPTDLPLDSSLLRLVFPCPLCVVELNPLPSPSHTYGRVTDRHPQRASERRESSSLALLWPRSSPAPRAALSALARDSARPVALRSCRPHRGQNHR